MMSTHMLLDEAGVNTHAPESVSAEMQNAACHQTDTGNPKTSHQCTHCIACAIATASASFHTAPSIEINSNTGAVFGNVKFYTSPYLISLIKPPISSV